MFSISNTNFDEDSLLSTLKEAYIKLKVAASTVEYS